MKILTTRSALPLVLVLLLLAAGSASAAEPVAEVQLHPTGLVLNPVGEAAGFVLTVSTPDGIVIRRAFGPRDTVSFSVAELQGEVLDGVYGYQLDMQPILSAEQRRLIERVRQVGDDTRAQIAGRLPSAVPSQSGYFTVYQGSIVPEGVERQEEPPPLAEGQDWASSGGLQSLPEKTVISGDLTVYNSLCVGFDCLSAESYGSDTIRLKENNLRIHFDDTSGGSFPANDWRILANSTASGGGSFLAIEDSSAGRQVFTVEAGAASNSLYVDTGTRVGIGTSTPVLNLHVTTGNSPGLRLEQNSSSGFAPQSWDIVGNETNFFVRDVTSGSRLPFRIRPGAPTSSIDISASGKVGIGTASPSSALHIVTATGGAADAMKMTNNGGMFITFENTSSNDDWFFTSANANQGSFIIDSMVDGVADGPEFTLDVNGNLTLAGTLTIVGGCTGCDAVFQPGFELESIEEHATLMWENSFLPGVGPTPEGQTAINVFEKTTGILQELEKAHIYIAQLNKRLDEKSAEVDKLSETVEELKKILQ